MDSENLAFIFPGQGSQKIGMGQDLVQTFPEAAAVFERANETLNFPLSKIAWEGPESSLTDTINTQPALLTHSIAVLEILKARIPNLKPTFVAGHSMGEISAMVASGSLDFPKALLLARKRGELMKKAGKISPGGMAAILGLDIESVNQVCQQAQKYGIVQIANDNCPGQVVISGQDQALEQAIILAKQAGAKRGQRLAVSIAAHSPLMDPAQQAFNAYLDTLPIIRATIPIIGNVAASPLTTKEEISADLQAQLTSRVRWTESIKYIAAEGALTFIEVGSGSVLSGLIKRIIPESTRITLGSAGEIEQFILSFS